MANGNSGRKKLANKLTTIIAVIVLVIAAFMGIDITEYIPANTTAPTEQQETQAIQNVEGTLVVHMIDVGQADSFLLVQDGKTALVDCGTRSTGKDAVEYIKELGITKLDYVIGTHPHDDHMGGMYDILTNFEIGTVIIPNGKPSSTTNWYTKLMNELSTGDYQIQYVKEGDILNLGDATMQVIAAETDVGGNDNNYSICFKVSFGQMDMIMTGDAETEVEEIILESGVNIDAEILKVGHHGSDTSSCEEFLDAVSADYAFISCGFSNKYDHPIESTMDKLEERDIEVYRTDECGTVVMTITTNSVSFSCEPGDYLSGTELEERESK